MTPQEDARVLMALVDRHLRALRLTGGGEAAH